MIVSPWAVCSPQLPRLYFHVCLSILQEWAQLINVDEHTDTIWVIPNQFNQSFHMIVSESDEAGFV